MITVIGLQFALLLAGAVLTESTFNWPGIGQKLVDYINNRDYGAVQGIVTFFAIACVADQPAGRHRQRADRPASEVLMAVQSTATDQGDSRRPGSTLVGRIVSPVRKTTGMARWILVSGILISTFFLVLAIFAPWIAPYGAIR